ncbi:hypothetical protein ACQY0O_000532 [Thecaphora frezii]
MHEDVSRGLRVKSGTVLCKVPVRKGQTKKLNEKNVPMTSATEEEGREARPEAPITRLKHKAHLCGKPFASCPHKCKER